jgi:hypothetical protein
MHWYYDFVVVPAAVAGGRGGTQPRNYRSSTGLKSLFSTNNTPGAVWCYLAGGPLRVRLRVERGGSVRCGVPQVLSWNRPVTPGSLWRLRLLVSPGMMGSALVRVLGVGTDDHAC